MITFTAMPHHCTAPVTSAVEAYSPADGLAHGSLDCVAFVCEKHVQTARAMWLEQRLTPYNATAQGSANTCGSVTDYRDTAPESVTEAEAEETSR